VPWLISGSNQAPTWAIATIVIMGLVIVGLSAGLLVLYLHTREARQYVRMEKEYESIVPKKGKSVNYGTSDSVYTIESQ